MYKQCVDYCRSLKGAADDYPFGPSPLVMKVGGKMFALFGAGEKGEGGSVSLKCDPLIADNLRQQYPAIKPGYHLNKKHWNSVELDGSIPFDELRDMMEHSYRLVLKGLSKAERERVEG